GLGRNLQNEATLRQALPCIACKTVPRCAVAQRAQVERATRASMSSSPALDVRLGRILGPLLGELAASLGDDRRDGLGRHVPIYDLLKLLVHLIEQLTL